ncbi:alpha/beta hydrolase [Marinobacterium jannaschii]|uniref:alpha/beta hydrolase n=1 Tax=Marinobacterium jannaschii TaxID=64970 RepID=UPI000488074D|nr:alpha/beta fold hydrolase [Marinobacterium jannaschii]
MNQALSGRINAEPEQRQRLRKKLGIETYLQQRQCMTVMEDSIHCELYHFDDDAPTLLFLPGIGTYSELYAELLARLSQRGFNLVAIDPPGHGYSGGPRGYYTIESVQAAVSAVIDRLEPRYQGPFGIFGFSIGATQALAAAENDARLKVLLCGTLLLPDIPPDLIHQMGWSWTWSGSLFFPGLKVPLRTLVDFDRLLSGHPAGDEINRDPLIVFDYPLSTLSSVFTYHSQVVTTSLGFQAAILHGGRDEVLPFSYSQRLVASLRHPFKLMSIPRAGHMTPWLRPECMVDIADQWLQSAFADCN